MKEKIKTQKGFIQIPILIVIITGIAVIGGGGFGVLYYQNSNLIKEANQLTEEEKYEEAVEKLESAQNSWLVKKLGLKKQEISNEIEKNRELREDKLSYNEALEEFNKENWERAINLFSEISEQSLYSSKAQLKIEIAKRKIAEKELGEAKVATEEAEQKAKQEEEAKEKAEEKVKQEEMAKKEAEEMAKKEKVSREAKERELAEKEAEEKELNADKDGDGLTYRQELDAGTSDLNTDSDGDGIPDGEDSHPAGGSGSRLIAQLFEWDYRGSHWTWSHSFPSDWWDYYKDKEHGSHSADYVTYNNSYIKKIANMLEERADEKGYSKSLFAMTFIQSLGYVGDEVIGYDDLPKYPLETLAEQNGDCEDTSYLAAAIISAMDIDCVLVTLPGHMAVAIAFSGSPEGYYYRLSNGWDYYYIETTAEGWELGEIPPEYKYTKATLIEIPSNETEEIRPNYIPFTTCWASQSYPGYYYDREWNYYYDSNCTTPLVEGCYKSTTYPGYYFDDYDNYYKDRSCTNLTSCLPSSYHSGWYFDGYDWYLDSQCSVRVQCIAYPDGYNDCGSGCQRCVNESCQDYDLACSSCQHCNSDVCVNYCQGIDTDCGCTSCTNCDTLDGCVGTTYYDYYCSGTSCEYHSSPNDSRCIFCTSHDSYSCYEGDIYWYDSCDGREEIKENCDSCQYCSEGNCHDYCSSTDIDCGCSTCVNCNNSDGCVGNDYHDYYCDGTSCEVDITYDSENCITCNSCQYYSEGSCHDYCEGIDTNCGCSSCVNCDDLDGWVDLEVLYSCCDENKRCTCQDQEYQDYFCSGTSCTYSVTDARVKKSECVECDLSEVCLDGICETETVGEEEEEEEG